MALAVRQDLHRAAGEALAAGGAPVAQVARQVALGAREGDLDAVAWLERAAAECSSLDPGAAIDLLEHAVDLAPPDWPGRARLRVQLVEPYARCGRFDDGRAIAAAVLAAEPRPLHRVHGPPRPRGHRRQRGSDRCVGRCAARSRRRRPARLRRDAELLGVLAAQIRLVSGKGGDAERRAVRAALDAAETSGDGPLACLAHQALGFVAAIEGREAEALRHFQSSTDLLGSGRAPWSAYLSPDGYVAACLLVLDRLDESATAADAARRRAERQAATSDLPFMHLITGAVPLFAGRFDDAVANFEAGLSVVEDSGAANFALYLDAGLALVALHRGDLAQAEGLLAAGFARMATGTQRFGADWLIDAQAQLLCARGEDEAALNLLEVLWAQMEPVRYFFGFRGFALHVVSVAGRVGRPDLASEAADALEEAASRTPATSASAAARRGRGMVEHDPVALLDAVALYRKTPLRLDLAGCCEDAAAVLATDGRRDEALALLDDAAAIYSDIRADGDLARVEAATRELGGRRRTRADPKPTFGWDALTAMEREVVDLVAQGLTNPEVGARLFVSRRTVETHLSHVFAKVGLSSRTQVAAEHARRSANQS